MHVGFFNFYEIYNHNRMFRDSSAPIGDDLLYPMVYLGQKLRQNGHTFNTLDEDNLEAFDSIVFMEYPRMKNKYFRKLTASGFQNLFLMAWESPMIHPDNYLRNNHRAFRKIFTWDDSLVDGRKYIKINYAHKIPQGLDEHAQAKSKLCTTIASNKFVQHPNELYTERVRAIRWFEANHKEDFDLYGIGWDEFTFRGPRAIRALNRLRVLKKIFGPHYPSFRGPVKSKRETLKHYKFAICYENARNYSGYITEKIFDCFFAHCVPIYLGATNITEHIPAGCFVDFRQFRSYEQLYDFLCNMPPDVYSEYQENIRKFITGPRFYPFSVECFADTIIRQVCGEPLEPPAIIPRDSLPL